MILVNLVSLVVRGPVLVDVLAEVRLGASVAGRQIAAKGHPDYPWQGTPKPDMGNTRTGITLGAGRSRRLSRALCSSSTLRRSLRGGSFAAVVSTGLPARRAASVSETSTLHAGRQGQAFRCSRMWETEAR